ncbi:hypothetical protein ACQKMD_00045 [Viridibacillus sp. NPDC096237]|uniref:hypothetical protein n=1 Tax=Viridibacillus sp. NPDC096237 TaxID=3390721 RepID=UPI003D009BD9
MRGTWMKLCVCSSLVIIGILIGYDVITQENISESDQEQVNNFQDGIDSNQRQPSSIEGGNAGYGTTKEYSDENEVESKSPGRN